MSHSILPPSGSPTWVVCPMWVSMNQLYPQEETQASLEGIAAHWVLTEMIRGVIVKIGDNTPQNVLVTSEMIEGADLVLDHLKLKGFKFKHLRVEETVDCTRIHPLCFGTPDIFYFDVSTNTIDVIDYKFGHRFVDEFKNYQCVIYTVGIIDKFAKMFNMDYEIFESLCKVNITIIQPRCYVKAQSVRTWSFRAEALRTLLPLIKAAGENALSDKPLCKPNSGCGDCSGRQACQKLTIDAYDAAHLASVVTPLNLDIEAAALEHKMLERAMRLLEARVGGLAVMIEAKLKRGEKSKHYHLTHSQGRRNWTCSVDEIIALGQAFNVDLSKLETVTPTQALKLGVDESVISCYSERKAGSAKLEADNLDDVAKVFGE